MQWSGQKQRIVLSSYHCLALRAHLKMRRLRNVHIVIYPIRVYTNVLQSFYNHYNTNGPLFETTLKIIIPVIFRVPHLTDKGEHTVLYKSNKNACI